MFQVINLATQLPAEDETGAAIVFSNGRDAAEYAQKLTADTGAKYQPRPIQSSDNTWKDREIARFQDGAYTRVPWHFTTWWQDSKYLNEHFAHVSVAKSAMIAYTESADKGRADRQTRIKPGAYLQRYFSDVLSSDEIQHFARQFTGEHDLLELKFAETADDIERVYTNGPSSCMSHAASDYDSPFHPVRVYAAGDLSVAYIEREECITARVLVWREKKRFGRIYGDSHRLQPLLESAGFVPQSLRGARLVRHEHDGGFVCPYIDRVYSVRDDGENLIIGGDIDAQSTNGLINVEPEGEWCPHCEDSGHSEYDMVYMEDIEEHWCESCAESDGFRCDQSGSWYAREHSVVQMANGDYWSTDHFERNGFTCDATGEAHHIDESVHLESRRETWSADHFARHGFTCRHCSENFANEDASDEDNEACVECERDNRPEPEEDDTELEPFTPASIARAGRDESPNQLELSIAATGE